MEDEIEGYIGKDWILLPLRVADCNSKNAPIQGVYCYVLHGMLTPS